jgi:hypothetical protein
LTAGAQAGAASTFIYQDAFFISLFLSSDFDLSISGLMPFGGFAVFRKLVAAANRNRASLKINYQFKLESTVLVRHLMQKRS